MNKYLKITLIVLGSFIVIFSIYQLLGFIDFGIKPTQIRVIEE